MSLIFILVVSLLGVSCDKSGDKPAEPAPDGAYYQSIGGNEQMFIFENGQLLVISYSGGEFTGFTSNYSIKDNFLNLSEAQSFDGLCKVTQEANISRFAYQFLDDKLIMNFGRDGEYGSYKRASEEQVQNFVSSFNCDLVTQFMSALPDL